eukprot:gene33440-42940_t
MSVMLLLVAAVVVLVRIEEDLTPGRHVVPLSDVAVGVRVVVLWAFVSIVLLVLLLVVLWLVVLLVLLLVLLLVVLIALLALESPPLLLLVLLLMRRLLHRLALLLLVLIARLEADRDRRMRLQALAFVLLSLGVQPFLMVMSRPEQPIMLAFSFSILLCLTRWRPAGLGDQAA